jgi:8-oxo-dGTP pyrophosphatase MutT (NUDIX family)
MIIASGVFFYCATTKRYLYLLRSDTKNWSLPGGKLDDGETLMENIIRECEEEMDYFPSDGQLIPIQKFVNHTFVYHTFFCRVENEFAPRLNEEHCGYAWVGSDQYPKPLHPGLFNTVNFEIVRDKLKLLTQCA